jgi:mannose-6-phosphate isomerase-like protein (cupin superfamily)
MRMSKRLLALHAAFIAAGALAQRHLPGSEMHCPADTARTSVTVLHHDSLSSSFIICIPRSVAPHLHRHHTEHVVVLEGAGTMLLGDARFTIAAGDALVIPAGTVHAVTRTSEQPLRVISIQSPRFDGSDRVPVPME